MIFASVIMYGLGGGSSILDTDCHSLYYIDRRIGGNDKKNTKSAPVIIEDDVLIGAYSIILKGAHIGARSVIGAGSIVSGEIPSDCIAAGNPCKVIRYIRNTHEEKVPVVFDGK